jgi:hypothetical protein
MVVVNALAVVGNEVYVGGVFTSAGGVSANEWRASTRRRTLGQRSARAVATA